MCFRSLFWSDTQPLDGEIASNREPSRAAPQPTQEAPFPVGKELPPGAKHSAGLFTSSNTLNPRLHNCNLSGYIFQAKKKNQSKGLTKTFCFLNCELIDTKSLANGLKLTHTSCTFNEWPSRARLLERWDLEPADLGPEPGPAPSQLRSFEQVPQLLCASVSS